MQVGGLELESHGALKRGVTEVGPLDRRTTQERGFEVRSDEVGSLQTGMGEIRGLKMRAAQVGSLQRGVDEPCSREPGRDEDGAVEPAPRELRAGE